MTRDARTDAAADGLSLPATLERQLAAFRRHVWTIKSIEAVCTATVGVFLAWLALFLLDRIMETPTAVRWGLFAAVVASGLAIPFACQRWIWRYRGLDRLARLIAGRYPSLGDQLLGIVEIVRSQAEWTGERGRSRSLCEAAIRQVAETAARHDLRDAVPRPRHRAWATRATAAVVVAMLLSAVAPAAASNAWARLLAPWRSVNRFTFARVDELPRPLVVPYGEPAEVPLTLRSDTRWRPGRAAARVGRQPAVTAWLDGDRYALRLPAQVSPATLAVAAGDARQRVPVVPTHRPEVTELRAAVRLPAYLEWPEAPPKDARGGVVSVVKGSTVTVSALVNRDLASAAVDGAAVTPEAGLIAAAPVEVNGPRDMVFTWKDTLGLEAAKPLKLSLAAREDEAPTIAVEGLAGRGVLLDTETIRFELAARDDFGVKQVGLEWAGVGGDTAAAAEDRGKGEKVLAVGGPQEESLAAVGTFSPLALGIRPQVVEVRLYAEDYLPGRGRTYSAPAVFAVMTAADHALWVNEQIARWRQQAAEVGDRELELLRRNEELARLAPEALDAVEARKAIREQAAAEAHNGRRLARLAENGAELVRQAARNPEFEADTLEELAQHVEALEEMGKTRMPDIGGMLRQAAEAAKAGGVPDAPARAAGDRQTAGDRPPSGEREPGGGTQGGKPAQPPAAGGEPPQQAGTDRGRGGSAADPAQQANGQEPPPPVPQVVDRESSASRPDGPGSARESEGGGGGGAGRLGLPTTTVAGPGGDRTPGAKPSQQALLDTAVDKQRQLVADFAKIAGQLGDVMARLEGTTFVKRLKSASRSQLRVGEELAVVAAQAFGNPAAATAGDAVARRLAAASRGNEELEKKLSTIMDDMDAYGERRPLAALKSVLEDMRHLDVLGGIRQVTADLGKESGVSIAQAEFWSDTFDRWADELVPPPPPPGGGGGGGGPPPASLPPEVVLEAMLILEAETNLREETRVADQVRKGLAKAAFAERATNLAAVQEQLAGRVADLVEKLEEDVAGPLQFEAELERMKREILPGGSKPAKFGREIALFRQVREVMADARRILASPETGRRAIAAETEAIELLLQSQFGGDGGGGGGGGGGPGGGGFGATQQAALARLGEGTNRKARLEAPEEDQAVGKSGLVLPEEFRDGLDAYFNAFERGRKAGKGQP